MLTMQKKPVTDESAGL